MKSLLKFSSLFALIIAGRYMQSVAPVGAGMRQKAPMALFAPANPSRTHYVGYDQPTTPPMIPASHRVQRKPASLTWY